MLSTMFVSGAGNEPLILAAGRQIFTSVEDSVEECEIDTRLNHA